MSPGSGQGGAGASTAGSVFVAPTSAASRVPARAAETVRRGPEIGCASHVWRPTEDSSVTTIAAASRTAVPQSEPAGTGFWAAVPRGARLDEAAFRGRHRILSVILGLHLPLLAAIGLVRGVDGFLLWGQLGAIVVLLLLGQAMRS